MKYICSHYKSILVSQEQEQEQEQEQAQEQEQEQEQEQPIHNNLFITALILLSVIKNSFPMSFSVFHMAEHSYNLFFLVGKC